jgi:hypothetical protein
MAGEQRRSRPRQAAAAAYSVAEVGLDFAQLRLDLASNSPENRTDPRLWMLGSSSLRTLHEIRAVVAMAVACGLM